MGERYWEQANTGFIPDLDEVWLYRKRGDIEWGQALCLVAKRRGLTGWHIDLNRERSQYIWEPMVFDDLDEAKAVAITLARMGG